MKILVTGASGYIGSAVCKLLKNNGHDVVGIDRRPIKHQYVDKTQLTSYGNIYHEMFDDVDAVVHIGATSLVGPSVTDPATYYQNNIAQTLNLLDAMRDKGINRFVFASSAACYGEPEEDVCAENSWHQPCNPYGWSKRMMEIILNDYAHAYNLRSVSLRFFNVAGADEKGRTGNSSPYATHLIKRATRVALGLEPCLTVFGNDYPTRDGSAIRDYIHVTDLIEAHMLALAKLDHQQGVEVFNCGYGIGYSVLEVIASIEHICGISINIKKSDRREGDAASVIASSDRIRKELGWAPSRMDINKIIETSLLWEETLNKK